MRHEHDQVQPILLRVEHVAKALGIARSTVYVLIAGGELPVVCIGRATRVPRSAVEQWVRQRTEQRSSNPEVIASPMEEDGISRVEGGGTKKRRARGEGGIRLRPDGRWEATLDLGAEGARRRRKFIYGKTKAEVRKALAEARRQQEEGTLITGRPPTVAQFLDAWLVSVKGNVRHKTYVSYEGTVRLHINPWIGRARVDRLTPVDVQALVTGEAARGRSAGCCSIGCRCCALL